VTASNVDLALLIGGAALLAIGEIGKRRRARFVGLAALLAGCAMTIIGFAAGPILAGA
jgi:hypothetical protein